MKVQNGLGFYIGNFFIAYYGLLIVFGIAIAAIIGWYQTKRHAKNYDDFIIIAAMGGLFGVIGAKLLYILVSLDQIDFTKILDYKYFNNLMSGGFVFYGGLIGGLVGLYICKVVIRLDVFSTVSIAIPCLPIVHGFGRIACSLVGCCYGKPYSGIGAITYENSLFAPNNQPLFPIQSMEALLNFIIAIILLIALNHYAIKCGLKLYLVMYSIVRFILEFFRYDNIERGILGGISTSQYISLIIIIIVCLSGFIKNIYTKTSKKGIS